MPESQPPLAHDELQPYLARVAYQGPLTADLPTLRALHRAHLLAIPYENLDIHLGRELSLDPARIYNKLVDSRRGGWCYEMNGLFGRVLEHLGFDVRYVAGAVGREARGDSVEGNHLVLIVTLDEQWIVDVGFGDGFVEPLPLHPGSYRQGFFEYAVRQADERWIVHNHEYGGADRFDFTLAPRSIPDFAAKCHELQTSPESGFVKSTVCQRFTPDGLVTLRGAVLQRVTEAGCSSQTIERARDYREVLRDVFGLEPEGVEALFPRVWTRHEEWMASQ
jgi:N-hydroxyarylamine O-acetyltransferase